jgi:hypothetical protein
LRGDLNAMAKNPFISFVDFLAKMGLILRGDPPRSIDVTGRLWGHPVGGLVLSVREIPRDEPDQLPSISVVMKNAGSAPVSLVVPGWLFFYTIEVEAPLAAYGKALLNPERKKERLAITLGPGDATETDLPAGSVYEMRAGAEYRVSVSCRLPDGSVLRSNEIPIRP